MSSTSAASGITFSNFTGIDFNAILNAETAAAQVPIATEQNKLVGVNTAISILGSISGDFTTLQNSLSTLNTSLTIPPMAATASANAPFVPSVTGSPMAGTSSVTVTRLAQAQSIASQGYASDSASIGDGTFSISVGGGAATPITIDSTNDTLDGLKDAINSASLGVTAQVVNTGAPGAPYRLVITANSTGTAAGFTVSSSLAGGTAPDFANTELGPMITSGVTGTSTPGVGGTCTGALSQSYQFSVVSGGTVGTDPLTINWTSDSGEKGTLSIPSNSGGPVAVADGLTLSLGNGTLNAGDSFSVTAFNPQLSAAQDATVQVGNQVVTSPTNSVTNAITGLNLQLTSVGTGSVTVSSDLTKQANNVAAFVQAYNQALGDIVYNTQALPQQTAPALAGDGGLRSMMFSLQNAMGGLNLSNLGISVDQQTGELVFNQSTFQQNMATQPGQVAQSITALNSVLSPLVSSATTPNTGLMATETASYNTQKTDIITKLTQMNNDLTTYTQQLQKEFASIQATVAGYQTTMDFLNALNSNNSSSSSSSSTGTSLTMSS